MKPENNFKDSPEKAYLRAHQDDPMIMHIVVRENTSCGRNKLLEDAAQSAVFVEIDLEPWFRNAFRSWWSESFRKIALVADEGEWDALRERRDYAQVGDVITFAPVQKSKRDSKFDSLRALKDLDLKENNSTTSPVTIYLLNSLGLGKQVAQAAHAEMMLARKFGIDRVARISPKVVFVDELPESNSEHIAVRDAGLTEVAAGTQTALAEIIEVPDS